MADLTGFENRARRLRKICAKEGIRFLRVSSSTKQVDGTQVVSIPEKYLPNTKVSRHPEWWRAHLLYLCALSSIPDYVWCVESDVDGSDETWYRLFSWHRNNDADLVANDIFHKTENPEIRWFSDASTPENHEWFAHPCLMRLSRKAVIALLSGAEATRNEFVEVCVPSLVALAGGKFGQLNPVGLEPVAHSCTLAYSPNLPTSNPRRFRHPVKVDSN